MGVRVVALKFLDIADGRAAEGVDGLVRITHHGELAATAALFADQGGDQHVLRVVGVLVLVDEHVPEAAAVVLRNLRVIAQDTDDLADQVVEVHGVRRPEALLVIRVQGGDGLFVEVAVRVRLGLRSGRSDELVLPVADRGQHAAGREFLDVQVVVLDDHGDQSLGVVRIVDREVGVQPRHEVSVAAQDAHAHGVEGGDPHPLGGGANEVGDTLAHLRRGLIGEGDREDLPGRNTSGQQPGDAAGQHAGLP